MPDEFLTIEQVAQQLALPPEMIRRRIESGDIPVHWVEADGKLEMRVAREDISPGAETDVGYGGAPLFAAPGSATESEVPASTPPDAPGTDWSSASEAQYPQGLWTPVEESSPSDSAPWGVGDEEIPLTEPEGETVPVWRPDPATWDDEPLEATEAGAGEVVPPAADGSTGAFGAFDGEGAPSAESDGDAGSPFGWSSGQPSSTPTPEPPPFSDTVADDDSGLDFGPNPEAAETAESPFMAPPAPGFGYTGHYEDEESLEDSVGSGPPQPSAPAEVAAGAGEEVAAPSTMLNASTPGPGTLAINSLDARELVAGLFERWERALEQRIQAEQRLRFEAELEQRMRQVRDLRQELDQTRQAQAAELAEREREVLELRNRIRELEQAPRGRGLFRR